MNKEQLISAIADETGSTKTQCKEFLDAYVKIVTSKLSEFANDNSQADASSSTIQLAGLGVFSIGQRKATVGRNPKTGEKIDIPAKKVAKFSPAKQLKEALN